MADVDRLNVLRHCEETNMALDADALARQIEDTPDPDAECVAVWVESVRALDRQRAGAVSLDDPRLIETLARVIENRHGTLHGIGSTLREALAELKREQ